MMDCEKNYYVLKIQEAMSQMPRSRTVAILKDMDVIHQDLKAICGVDVDEEFLRIYAKELDIMYIENKLASIVNEL